MLAGSMQGSTLALLREAWLVHVVFQAVCGSAIAREHVRAELALIVEASLEEHSVEADVIRILNVHMEQSKPAVWLDLQSTSRY